MGRLCTPVHSGTMASPTLLADELRRRYIVIDD